MPPETTAVSLPKKKFDVFISYSHGASGALARGIQNALQRFAKPWWRRRSLNVFRDETDLSANPNLWRSIVASLNDADWLILIASPQAVASKWVNRELRHWLGDPEALSRPTEDLDIPLTAPDKQRAARIVFVLASGGIVWRDGPAADFDWTKTDALPRCLSGAFTGEPLWIDLSRIVGAGAKKDDLDARNPEFHSAIARIFAGVKNADLASLIGEDARQHRRAIRTAWSAASALAALAIVAVIAAWLALLAAAAADKQRLIAEADRQTAWAQNLLARSPANLVEAGQIAITSFASMQALSQTSTAPAWLIWLIDTSGLGQWQLLGQIVEANRYHADFDRLQPAVDVIRTVEQLLPEIQFRARTPSGENANHVAILDGDILVSQNYGNALQVRRIGDSNTIGTTSFGPPVYRINGIANTAFSSDGRYVASESAEDGVVRVVDAVSGAVIGTIDPRSVFEPAAFTMPASVKSSEGGPNSETFTAGGQSGDPLLAGLALSSDGQQVFLITRSGKAGLFAVSDGTPIHSGYSLDAADLKGLDRLSAIVLDAKAEQAVLASSSNIIRSVPIVVLGTNDGKPKFASLLHSSSVGAIGFTADGRKLATGTDDGWVFVWDSATGLQQQAFNLGSAVRSLAFGRGVSAHLLLVGTDDGLARLYDLSGSREIARMPHAGRMDAVAWDKDGQRFATGTVKVGEINPEPIRIWAINRMMAVSTTRMTTQDGVHSVAASKQRLAAISWPSSLTAWDYTTGALIKNFPDADVARLPFSFAPDGKTITTIAKEDDGLAYVFDIETGGRRTISGPGLPEIRLSDRTSHLASAAFDKEGKRLVRFIQGVERPLCRIEIWTLGEAVPSDQVECVDGGKGMDFDDAGRSLAWIDTDTAPRLVVRDVPSRATRWEARLPFTLSGYMGEKIAFDGEGKNLAVAGKDSILVFNAADGGVKTRIDQIGSDIINLTMSGDGARLAVSSPDRLIRIFDAENGQLVQRMPYRSDTLGAGGLVFTEDGGRLMAAFADSNSGNPDIWQWHVEPDVMARKLAERLAALADHQSDTVIAKDSVEPSTPR